MIVTKKTDKIVVLPFIKIFILILGVTIFIMLMQFFLIWFDELIGKNLGLKIYLQLFLYFGIGATPMAFPLATLVSSLMVFGSLGEQLELTALKSAGIPFIRILQPLLFLMALLSAFVYFSNGYIVPKVTVKAHTLLYDLRKKKPSVAIKEGVFYNGIPEYSIRVEGKLPDQQTLEGITIYDHTKNKGNIHLTTAASGLLTTVHGERYLAIELFNGHNYLETMPSTNAKEKNNKKSIIPNFTRMSFKSQKVLIDLDIFKLTRTSEKYFTYYHTTKTTREIIQDISKMQQKIHKRKQYIVTDFQKHFHLSTPDSAQIIADTSSISTNPPTYIGAPEIVNDQSIKNIDTMAEFPTTPISTEQNLVSLQRLINNPHRSQIIRRAINQAKDLKQVLQPYKNKIVSTFKNLQEFKIEKNKRASYALSCMLMLLIGASLGALIKKGGLGLPLLISTAFIMLYYITDMFGTKWAKLGLVNITLGVWAPNLILLPFGLFFFRQAQKDARILEKDAYFILWHKILKLLGFLKK